MLMDDYAAVLTGSLERIAATQREAILEAAGLVCGAIAADALIYVFGCGHSGILAEESFYRAGGLACVSPIFYGPLMLHESASRSSSLEKRIGLAEQVLQGRAFGKDDILICASTSGINAVPVELAAAVRGMGVRVVGITSGAYLDQPPRNALGRHLSQVCDVWVDNMAPHGDACLQPEGLEVGMTPVSTVLGAYILNSILAEGVRLALERGLQPPVYLSGNIPGGAEYNRALIRRYQSRIPCL